MEGFDANAYHEAFLKANANAEFISSELADVIRCLMRGVSSDDPSSAVYSATEKMNFVTDLISRSSEPLSWHQLFREAVREIQECMPDDADERRFVRAAMRGTKYLVESSATDNAARGRAATRLREFTDAIRWSLEARGGRL